MKIAGFANVGMDGSVCDFIFNRDALAIKLRRFN